MSYHNGEKRSQVVRLLEGGTARKLMRGEVARAFESIWQAYELATSPPGPGITLAGGLRLSAGPSAAAGEKS